MASSGRNAFLITPATISPKEGKQEHEPKRFTIYHGAFKHQYHNELVRSCVHRYRKIRGSASNRIRSIYHDFNHA